MFRLPNTVCPLLRGSPPVLQGSSSPHPSPPGVGGAGHSKTGSIQAASPRAFSESAGVAGGRCRVKALMLTGVPHVVGSCTALRLSGAWSECHRGFIWKESDP